VQAFQAGTIYPREPDPATLGADFKTFQLQLRGLFPQFCFNGEPVCIGFPGLDLHHQLSLFFGPGNPFAGSYLLTAPMVLTAARRFSNACGLRCRCGLGCAGTKLTIQLRNEECCKLDGHFVAGLLTHCHLPVEFPMVLSGNSMEEAQAGSDPDLSKGIRLRANPSYYHIRQSEGSGPRHRIAVADCSILIRSERSRLGEPQRPTVIRKLLENACCKGPVRIP